MQLGVNQQKSRLGIRRKKLTFNAKNVIDLTGTLEIMDSESYTLREGETSQKTEAPRGGEHQRVGGEEGMVFEKNGETSRVMRNSFFYGQDSDNEEYTCSVRPNSSRRQKEEGKEVPVPFQEKKRLSTFRGKNKASKLESLQSITSQANVIQLVEKKINRNKGLEEKQVQEQREAQEKVESQELVPAQTEAETNPSPKKSSPQPQFPVIDSLSQLAHLIYPDTQAVAINDVLYSTISQHRVFQGYIKRLNKQNYCMYSDDSTFMMRAEKSFVVLGTNYYISSSTKVDKTNEFYLGKLKGNISRNAYTLLDNGSSWKEGAPDQKEKKGNKMHCFNIQLQNKMFETRQPKKLTVTIPHPKIVDTAHFRLPESESLQSLKNSYPHQLINLRNKKPVWNESVRSYGLDLGPRVKMTSIKNIVLENGYGANAMVFGKVDGETFFLEVGYPLSPYQGFGVALAMFDCQ